MMMTQSTGLLSASMDEPIAACIAIPFAHSEEAGPVEQRSGVHFFARSVCRRSPPVAKRPLNRCSTSTICAIIGLITRTSCDSSGEKWTQGF